MKSPLARVSQCHPGMWGWPNYADLQAAEISIYTSTDEADEAANLEDTASAEKVAVVAKCKSPKCEATKASKIDTKFKKIKSVQCHYTSSF